MSFVKIASVDDVKAGTVKIYELAGKQIALCHAGDQFFAVEDVCTHDGGPLGEGELVDCQIECPRHGARFDIKTGQALTLPAVTPVPTYPLEIRGNEILIKI
jgi:3-phenylpropionate/trans-cinnamate dioxygenase ferredoxin component